MTHTKNPILALALFFMCMAHPALAAEGKAFNDSFSALDKSRWYVSSGWTNGTHQSCEWRDDAVSIKDGKLLLTLSDHGGKVLPIGCPELHTKERLNYGRYEARMRSAAGWGLNTAFFSYIGPPNGVPEWDEIDFEFLGITPTKVEVNYVVNGKIIHGKTVDLGFDASKNFHDYVFDWSKTGITWFVDGKEVYKTQAGAVLPRNPGSMFFSLWSGTAVEDSWMGKFTYTKPVSAEVVWARFTPH